MTQTTQPFINELINQLPADLREEFEERAAIMEFESGLPRAHAECLALLDILHRHGGIAIKQMR